MVLYAAKNPDGSPLTREDQRAAAANQLRGIALALDPDEKIGIADLVQIVWRIPKTDFPADPPPQTEPSASGGVPAIAVPRGPFDRLIRAITPVRDVYLRRLADHHDEAADWSDHPTWPVTVGMLRKIIFARDNLIEPDYELLRPAPQPRAVEASAAAIVPPPVSAEVADALAPLVKVARGLPNNPDTSQVVYEWCGNIGEIVEFNLGHLRALLRAAGLFTDDMRPSQPAAADASVKPAEAAPLPPPADAHHSDDDESAETGQDADAVAPVRARDGLGDASHAGAPRADEAAGEQSLAADRREQDPF